MRVGVKPADQVVALVLHHPGVETVDCAVDRIAVLVEAGVADTRPAGHQATQAGTDRQPSQPSSSASPTG